VKAFGACDRRSPCNLRSFIDVACDYVPTRIVRTHRAGGAANDAGDDAHDVGGARSVA
jgi:hypothetical protein